MNVILMINNLHVNAHLHRHESMLTRLIEQTTIPAARLKEAMLYTLFPGGKRIRPLLVYLCGDLLRVDQSTLDILAAAIEFMHTYSLVHDDLPAMDNDDFRRGKSSCHRAFDEATAILVGDALHALAIDVLLTHLPTTLQPQCVLTIVHELVRATGPSGMLSGQSLDLSELTITHTVNESILCTIHHLKTGKLILACINMVLAASQASFDEAQDLRLFANHLGLVFQIQDDYLDHYVSTDHLGKMRASDQANQKTTFATHQNQETLSNTILQHFKHTQQALTRFGQNAEDLHTLVQSLLKRTHPKIHNNYFS